MGDSKKFNQGGSEPSYASKVERAARMHTPEGKAAFEALVPVMLPIVTQEFRKLHPQSTLDGVHEFIASTDLMSGRFFSRFDRRQARFKAYVRGAARRSSLERLRSKRTEIRGGAAEFAWLDAPQPVQLTDRRPSPEAACETNERFEILALVRKRLQAKHAAKPAEFDALWDACADPDYSTLSLRLRTSQDTARVRMCRFKEELQKLALEVEVQLAAQRAKAASERRRP